MSDLSGVSSLVDEVLPEVTEIRHLLHQNPELALQEQGTAALIRERLEPTGLLLLPPFLETDVVGILSGSGDGRNVTLRADTDALPLQEESGVPYQSRRDGCMHACGHDGHTAMLIGAARVLSQLTDLIQGSVRFVFQPGEEMTAGGKDLVAAGALLDPEPDMVFALHAWAGLPVGVLGSRSGPMMAAADFFSLTIKGAGAHGCMPHESIDPIVTGARIVESLQTIVSRSIDPQEAAVVSVCRFSGGTTGNVIPEHVELQGTVRYHIPEVGERIVARLEETIRGICESTGASHELTYDRAYIPMVNDLAAVDIAAGVAREMLGDSFWRDIDRPSMGGEDFAYYTDRYPGALVRLGVGEDSPPLHNPHFDFNDGALRNGIIFHVACALRLLCLETPYSP